MKQRMKKLEREIKVYMTDSRAWNTIKYNYLLGGIMTAIRRKPVLLIQEKEIYY